MFISRALFKSPTRGEDDKSLVVVVFLIFCFKHTTHTGTQFNWNYFECEDCLNSLRLFILTVVIFVSSEPLRET